MSDNLERDLMVGLQTIHKQLGSIEARLDDLDDRVKTIAQVVHFGNGKESVLTRLTLLERTDKEQQVQVKESKATKVAVGVAVISSLCALGTALIQSVL